jgi:hypothetical protein
MAVLTQMRSPILYTQLGTSVLTNLFFLFLFRLINLNVLILYCTRFNDVSSYFCNKDLSGTLGNEEDFLSCTRIYFFR